MSNYNISNYIIINYNILYINNQTKRIVNGQCHSTSLSECALYALGLYKIPKQLNYLFNSFQVNNLTSILGIADSTIINPGFLGADVASSILYYSNTNIKKYLWFFGDTLFGKVVTVNGVTQRLTLKIPRNSIGIWTFQNNKPTEVINHYITIYTDQANQNKDSYGFFSPIQPNPENPIYNYWPINAININNEYYVLCEKILIGSLNTIGIDILKLNINDIDSPSTWTYEYKSTIPKITTTYTIGNTSIINKNFVYLFGSSTTQYNGFVTRLSTNNFILGNWNLLELYTNILIPKQLFYPLALTSTIQWFPFMNSWIILTIDKFIYGPKVALFYSNELYGEWKGPIFIYNIPEYYLIDSNIVYYAPMLHPEFCQESNEIYWTYNLNSFSTIDLVDDLNIYTPKMIKTIININ